jgi:hypothetical protein
MSDDPVEIVKPAPLVVTKSEITGQNYSMATVEKAYYMFMIEGKPPRDIAAAVGVPSVVVEEWSRKNQWARRLEEYARETVKSLNASAVRLQAQERMTTIQAQMEKARALQEKAQGLAMTSTTAVQIKNATEAVTSAAAMEARAVGLAEKTVAHDEDPDPQKQGQQSYVFIGIGARPPPEDDEKPAIDVQSEVRK